MQLSFIFPNWLWLLLLLAPLWAITLLAPRRLARWRWWGSLLLRTIALVGLVLGLAGTQWVQPVGTVTTIFLLDGSDSVALSQRARAETFIQQALSNMPITAQAALVVFGQHALVERIPSNDHGLGHISAQPAGGATNLEEAVRLGLALLPNEGYQRLVLLSDGGENTGDVAEVEKIAATRGVPIDVVALNGLADGLDTQIDGVELPATARVGQHLRLKINITSNQATSGNLQVTGPSNQVIVDQHVQITQGAQTFEVELPEALPFFNRYVVHLEVPNDARPENNAAEAYSFVSGQPHVLLIEGTPGDSLNLANALQSAQIEVSRITPTQMPSNLGDLSAYDAVGLVNVPKQAVSDQSQTMLSTYVHDLGRGLLMIGGDQSFGAGGWRNTTIESILPVTMDIPSYVNIPASSIVVLIDVSGSMGASENGRSKISLAAEGAQRIAALLRDEDELTVVMFDSEAQQVVGPLPGSRRDEAIEALNHTEPGGGGINIHDGLEKAASFIRQSTRPIRHIITITDGSDTVQQEGALDLVRQLRAEHVTLTSIAVGAGDHVPFIRSMASTGGGRTFLTDRASNLPTILTQETQAVIQPYIIEQTFTPTLSNPHPILRGIMHTPQLKGYVTTTPRQTAQIVLATPRGDPLLASWQYGLGHAVAWTSDLKSQWAQEWVSWDQFPRFSAQLLGWLFPTSTEQDLTLQSSSTGNELVLNAQAQDSLGKPQTGLQMTGRLINGQGAVTEVTLREVGPGRYRVVVDDAQPGAYLVQLIAQDPQGQPFAAVTAGAVVPRSAEYNGKGANPGLLEALVHNTGGRMNPQPAAAFDANMLSQGAVQEIGIPLLWLALLLLPFDIALRRLVLAHDQMETLLKRIGLGRLAHILVRTPIPAVTAARPPHSSASTTLSPPTQIPGPPATPTKKPHEIPSSDLDRMRAAQERARRRARGEE